ncbi:FMN-binding negative transcriptional regulator [Bacillus sp. EAC]|uniref:FMN-binding negative transcriptional regulator n=1 Tax=Bacillus sp. EAC TaxID=1978338 RepID=UPI000B44C802|nr:FMN-binding negative transcriptional regulator [Bacillus sp. EAC]
MYVPKEFKENDINRIISEIQKLSFGILLSTNHEVRIEATHLPFIVKKDHEKLYLITHLAKPNPQWKSLEGKECLVVFQGPHGYVSASWYEEKNTVSTWNYTAIHVYGQVKTIQDKDEMRKIVLHTTDYFEKGEASPWKYEDHQEYVEKLLSGIVCLEIEVTELIGKKKLSQNHSVDRREKVISALQKEEKYQSREIAELMKGNL